MKRLILGIAVFATMVGSASALIFTNVYKFKARTSTQMEYAIRKHFAGNTNFGSERAKWQAYFDIMGSNTMNDMYRDAIKDEKKAAAEAAAQNTATNAVESPVGD